MTGQLLQGRVAVVTGASRGLGMQIAQALAAEGAQVALLARYGDAVAIAAARIGTAAMGIVCDVSDSASVNAAFEQIAARFGRIDILVNNAAVTELHRVEHASDDSIQKEIAVNLMGPIFCIRAAVPHMRSAGGGDIVNISSVSVNMPFPFLTIYAATKAGLETLTAGLRAELDPDGIRVATLRVGHMEGGEISAHWDPDERAAFFRRIAVSGHAAMGGNRFPPGDAARALVQFLTLPRSISLDLIEIKSGPAANITHAKDVE